MRPRKKRRILYMSVLDFTTKRDILRFMVALYRPTRRIGIANRIAATNGIMSDTWIYEMAKNGTRMYKRGSITCITACTSLVLGVLCEGISEGIAVALYLSTEVTPIGRTGTAIQPRMARQRLSCTNARAAPGYRDKAQRRGRELPAMSALASAHQFERCEHVLHRVVQPVIRTPGDLEIAFYVVECEPALHFLTRPEVDR